MLTTDDHGNMRGASNPRSIVRLDGKDVWFNNWSVNLNSTHVADDFTVEMPFRITRDMPGQSYQNITPDYASYLFANSNILVEIFVGYPNDKDYYQASDLTRIMYGYMDQANLSLSSNGERVTLTGRNMIAPFLDNKTTQKYQNMTSSAIAQMLAERHGVKAMITPTYTLAGTYYNNDAVQMTSDNTEWDLLTYLASQEAFLLRVKDNALYFGPFNDIVGQDVNLPLNYTWGQNVMSATIDKQPHAAKNITIEVHSYEKSKKKHVKAVANSKMSSSSSSSAYTEKYFYPGLTQDQAQNKAESLLHELSALEVTGSMSVMGHELLTVDRLINLYGMGLGLSSAYYVRKATHKYDFNSGGYQCDVTFSNLLLPDEQTSGGSF